MNMDKDYYSVGGSAFAKVYRKPWKKWLEEKNIETLRMGVDELKEHFLAWKWGYKDHSKNRTREGSWQQTISEIKAFAETGKEIQDEAMKHWIERNLIFEEGCKKQWLKVAGSKIDFNKKYDNAKREFTGYFQD